MLSACSTATEKTPPRPNVLLITVDSLRADRLGYAGYEKAETSQIDGLAARGTAFTRAVTPVPESAPAIASIFTGSWPPTHGLRTSQDRALPDDAVTMAERFKLAGYHTGAVASSLDLHTKFGLDQGFDSYTGAFADAPRPSQLTEAGQPAGRVTDLALEFLQTARGEKFFLWVNYFDPHYFYVPPEPFSSRYSDRPYDGEIAYVDRELGRLLAKLTDYGIENDTVIVLAGTSGEGLGDGGEAYHGVTLHRATTRVPLIIIGAGFTPGATVATPVSLIDLAPTLLGLTGIEHQSEGVSLAPGADGKTGGAPRPIYLEATMSRRWFGWSPLVAVIDGDYKYVSGARDTLYDMAADPNETHDLMAEKPDVAGRLELLVRDYVDRAQQAEKRRQPPADAMIRVGRLGYPVTPVTRPVIDPRDFVAVANDAMKADRTARRRQLAGASFLLQQVLTRDPANYLGLLDTSLLAGAMGDDKSKKLLLERVQSLYPEASEPYRHLGYVALASGLPDARDRARELYLIATILDPHNEEAWYDLACALSVAGKKPEALDALQHAVEEGFRDYEVMASDRDLDQVRVDPRFDTITSGKAHKIAGSPATPPAAK